MGSLRTEEDKEWYVLHQFICKAPLTPEKLVYLKRGWERCTVSQERLSGRNSLLGEGQGNGKKFPIKSYLPHLRIECIATTLSAILMRK